MVAAKPSNVDEYIAGFPPEVAGRLIAVRDAIHDVLPGSPEKLRYGMPAIEVRGRYWMHFAGWKHHIGLYPVPRAEGALEEEIAPWRSKTDTVELPYSKPLPLELVRDIAGLILSLHSSPSTHPASHPGE
ncbi:iron chaperone [Agromyces seonyuensis]|uniref:DUF1801 domain-containing protein n=1 Tax=Agromyces seonyuensis TaxID=2662446 RepID=A0A6I4P219_9MICO|nr:DUF1801 domain-containing protein [Agromyces seonyuensis]MWB97204.1 DUF1801 domain-containing protein [Agromyces seonyuensis]